MAPVSPGKRLDDAPADGLPHPLRPPRLRRRDSGAVAAHPHRPRLPRRSRSPPRPAPWNQRRAGEIIVAGQRGTTAAAISGPQAHDVAGLRFGVRCRPSCARATRIGHASRLAASRSPRHANGQALAARRAAARSALTKPVTSTGPICAAGPAPDLRAQLGRGHSAGERQQCGEQRLRIGKGRARCRPRIAPAATGTSSCSASRLGTREQIMANAAHHAMTAARHRRPRAAAQFGLPAPSLYLPQSRCNCGHPGLEQHTGRVGGKGPSTGCVPRRHDRLSFAAAGHFRIKRRLANPWRRRRRPATVAAVGDGSIIEERAGKAGVYLPEPARAGHHRAPPAHNLRSQQEAHAIDSRPQQQCGIDAVNAPLGTILTTRPAFSNSHGRATRLETPRRECRAARVRSPGLVGRAVSRQGRGGAADTT